MIRVIGIDPGTATTGFAVLDAYEDDIQIVEFGLIETAKDLSPEKRLISIYTELNAIVDRHNPSILVIEKVFFSSNVKTAIRVGQAQGVMLLSAAYKNIPVAEYAPGTIKKVVAGDGRADKKLMVEMVRVILGPKAVGQVGKKTHFDNAADALAIAMTHIYTTDVTEKLKKFIDDVVPRKVDTKKKKSKT